MSTGAACSADDALMTATPFVIQPPAAVLEIVRTLRDAGYESWCVGGAVRDALLGLAHLDWDLATSATPPQVRRLFARTIPVGIEFGTVGVLDSSGRMHEVTTFRRDITHDGRHAVVAFGASLDEDLARRDFTINAIAYDPIERRIRDPFSGQRDLVLGVVRAVGEPQSRMLEDRLRALRAIRFASRFDFAIDAGTWRAIVESGPFLARLSPERVKQEIEKTMEQVRQPSAAFRRWRDAGAFDALIPALGDVSEPVLDAIDCLPVPESAARPQRRGLRIAALFSDLTVHDTEMTLRSLRFSNQDVAWIGALVGRWHSQGADLTRRLCSAEGIDDVAVRRLVSGVGRLRCGPFVRLAAARWSAQRILGDGTDGQTGLAPAPARIRDLHRRVLRTASIHPLHVADLAIDGDDLRLAGVKLGPAIGRVLLALLDDVLDDPTRNRREWLLSRAATLIDGHDGVGR